MPTLLTNKKMSPALAARIEKSLRHGRTARLGHHWVALLRVAVLLVIVGSAYSLLRFRGEQKTEFSRQKQELLADIAEHGALTDAERQVVPEVEGWLKRLGGEYAGDSVTGKLVGQSQGLLKLLGAPSVYVRGDVDAFAAAGTLREAAANSQNDAFVLCLLDPPTERTERELLRKVRAAYGAGGTLRETTKQVSRLHAAHVGLQFLNPEWEQRARAAETPAELSVFKQQYGSAPLEATKQVLRSRLLLALLDEPGEAGKPIELDGERPHQVRFALVDLAAGKILLQLRRRVDPSWVSAKNRARYSRGLDDCALAMDIHSALGADNGAGAASSASSANPAPSAGAAPEVAAH